MYIGIHHWVNSCLHKPISSLIPPACFNLYLNEALESSTRPQVDAILDFELSLCDTQPSQIWGMNGEFLSSPRLDNQAVPPLWRKRVVVWWWWCAGWGMRWRGGV